MEETFKQYLERHRAKFIKLTKQQEKELARLYIEAAANISERAEAIINKKSIDYAQARIRIRSLLREASKLTNDFEGLLNKSLIEAADLGQEAHKVIMQKYQDSLFEKGISVNLKKVLFGISQDAVNYTFNKIWSDGLKLSDRIWRLDRVTKQEIERIVMQNIMSGGAASDELTTSALKNLLNPYYTPTKLTSLHGRKVCYEASRLLRTETSVAANEAERLAAERNPGVTNLKWLVAIGACEQCQPLDGRPVSEVGYPPLHPSCRCTVLSEVQSVESFTERYLNFMDNPSSDIALGNWLINVYQKYA